MALGGGTFTTQNKELPGAYINFVSAANSSAALSDRGIAAMPLDMDWGEAAKVLTITNEDFMKNSLKIFGYAYDNAKLKGLRELFANVKTLFAYRLNGGGVKASNDFATAKYPGTRGNDLKIVIAANVVDNTKWDVSTLLGTEVMDVQTVSAASGLVSNDWVDFKGDATLEATAGTALTGGTNSTVTGTQHQAFIDAIESYKFNTLGVVTTEATTKALYTAFVKRMRDEIGVKFQLVLHNYTTADYEGVISVKNVVTDTGASAASLVYWVTGVEAACEVNKSVQNKKYDGEFTVNTSYTQAQLITAKNNGEFVFHNVNNDVRVLEDINTLVTTTDTKGDVFKDNQTIRVIDQIGNDDAVLFNTKYLGVVPNDEAGRISLWSDLVKIRQQLQEIRAIEDFSDSDVVVTKGNTKKSVVVDSVITVVNAMSQLYMTVVVQ